ncbi:MAG TPA: LysR family transcriptional regulator [Ferruginibacter sp.]|nr:LysR family transcriptional regulator [Ferruginibacter sp.]HMP21905.1 LysR family transcriptional regulator [Ferruginibacter sp.]
MNYTLNQLRIFLKVVELKSITRAAEELHLTQPAVSIQLKNFQQQFDIPLIEIINKQAFITDFGNVIADSARRILLEVDNIDNHTHAYKGQLTGKLKISVVSTGKYVAPYFISGFMKMHTGVELMLDVTNKEKVIQTLKDNDVDFSMVSVLPPNMMLEKIELMQNKLFLVGNGEQKFAAKVHDKSIFKTLQLIYREEGSGTRHVMERFIKKNRLPVQKKMELTSNEAVKQAVIAGLGYSIMPLIGIKNELLNGDLQIISVKGFPIKSTWYLIWQRNKKHTAVSTAFLNYVKEEKQQIIKSRFHWFENFKK